MITVAFIVYSVLVVKPIELWKKTPYFWSSSLALILFQTTMLCPDAANSFSTVPNPDSLTTDRDPFQLSIIISLLLFSFGLTWLVNHLLG